MKKRFNRDTGVFEYYDRLTGEQMRYNKDTGVFTGEGIFDIFKGIAEKVGFKTAKKMGEQVLQAGTKRFGEEAGKYAGEKLFVSKPKPHGEIIMKELDKQNYKAKMDRLLSGAGKNKIK